MTKGDRVGLCKNMCQQLKVRKLHGTIIDVHNVDYGPCLEISWDNPDVTNIELFYHCEVFKLKHEKTTLN